MIRFNEKECLKDYVDGIRYLLRVSSRVEIKMLSLEKFSLSSTDNRRVHEIVIHGLFFPGVLRESQQGQYEVTISKGTVSFSPVECDDVHDWRKSTGIESLYNETQDVPSNYELWIDKNYMEEPILALHKKNVHIREKYLREAMRKGDGKAFIYEVNIGNIPCVIIKEVDKIRSSISYIALICCYRYDK